MIRGELLRTKSILVSVEHRQELSSLSAIRERESSVRGRVQGHEERFWREITQASSHKKSGQPIARGAHQPMMARAMQAHRLLKQAKEEHSGLTRAVQVQVEKVIRAKVAVTAYAKMQDKERVQQLGRLAERQGEELEELQAAHKINGVKEVGTDGSSPVGAESDGLGEALASREMWSVSALEWRNTLALQAPQVITPLPSSQEGVSVVHEVPNPIAPVAVCSASVESTPEGHTLQVQMESCGVPVACHLSSKPSGEVGVVIEAPYGALVGSISRERSTLVAKLSELGLKVSRFEVKQESNLGSSLGGYLRRNRRNQEDEDENVIA